MKRHKIKLAVKESIMYHINRIIKNWLIGTILLLAIYAVIFLFRKNFDHTFLLWVMVLTPVTCLVFLFLTNLFDNNGEYRKDQLS